MLSSFEQKHSKTRGVVGRHISRPPVCPVDKMFLIYRLIHLCSEYGTYLTFILLMWRKYRAPNNIPVYIKQDTTLHSLFISGNCSTYFGWYFNPSSGAHTTVSTASVICHTVTSVCRYRGRVGTGMSVLWAAYTTHSTLKPVPTLPR